MHDLALDLGALGVLGGHVFPRMLGEMLHAEADALFLLLKSSTTPLGDPLGIRTHGDL
jgi:hypothetical protein